MITATASKASDKSENFAAMFEESLSRKEMRAGEVITAEVVRIDANFVVVNAGLKSESYIAIEELEDGCGETRLSREKAKRLAAWHEREVALEEGKIVQGLVNGKVKGGLT